ncbi:MAG: class I SAM-dependent methyltransferase [Schleiferiaceae bacterium]|nr:class I SAM-dependent methyltransferase [Schleiferiaceae bacterium]
MIEHSTGKKSLRLEWIDFEKSGSEIEDLRKKVFIEEQGFERYEISSEYDKLGLHLGLFNGHELAACVSIYLYEPEDPFLENIATSPTTSFAVRFTKRVELPDYRSKNYSKMMLAHALRSIYELFQPNLIFATLIGKHILLKKHYVKLYGFNETKVVRTGEPDETHILLHNNPEQIKNLYLNLRLYCLENARNMGLSLPDLTNHIFETPILTEYLNIEVDTNNRYLEPLSLADELPRLSAQARMLFKGMRSFWETLLAKNPEKRNILDLGCGPGIYLTQLSKLPQSAGRKFTGLDISDEFITYSKFAHGKLDWRVGSAYDSKIADQSVDIVQASFLFIHLTKPLLALKEVNRILKPGGLLVITDVNDSTFTGPPPVLALVTAHKNIYEGNREIMSEIISIAAAANLRCIQATDLTVTNTGSDEMATFTPHKIDLGKWTMWGLLAFMGQRKEIIDIFERAEAHYIQHSDEVTLKIQTRVFQKPN